MNVTVNDTVYVVDDSTYVDSLLDQLNLDAKGIAVAINLNVVAKSDWSTTLLNKEDKITIIKATQGG